MALSSGLTFKPNVWATSTPASTAGKISQSAYQDYAPLISDLITYNAPANKYLKSGTYSGDPEAIKARLGEYSIYDPEQYGTLANYLKPKASAIIDNQMLFKPSDFQNITGNLSALETSQLPSMTPMLGGLKSVGALGGQTYYTKPELETQLGKYATTDLSKYSALPEFKNLKPVATLGDKPYYSKAALETAQAGLGNYATADISKYLSLPEFKNLKPVATIDNNPYYSKSALETAQNALGNYATANVADYSSLPGFKDLKSVATIDNQPYYLKSALESAQGGLGDYVTADLTNYLGIPEFKNLKAITTIGGKPYYSKSELEKAKTALENYVTADISPYASLAEFKNLKPITTIEGKPYYAKSALETAKAGLGNYQAIDYNALDPTTWAGAQARQKALKVGDNYVLTAADVAYLKDPSAGTTWTVPGGYGITGQGGRGYNADTYYTYGGGIPYLIANPDVAASGLNPFQHYLQYGIKEGRVLDTLGTKFNPTEYLKANPDVAAAGVDPTQHYLQYGYNEGRAINPAGVKLNEGFAAFSPTGAQSAPVISALFGSNPSSAISQAYLAYLGRPAETAGLKYWQDQVSSGALSAAQAVEAIRNSAEGQKWLAAHPLRGDVLEKNTYDYITSIGQYLNTKHPTGYAVNPLDLAKIGYVADPNKPGEYNAGPYFLPSSIFEPEKGSNHAFWWTNLPTAEGLKANAVKATVGGQEGMLFPSYQNYENAILSSGHTPNANYQWGGSGGWGGWFGGILGELGKGIQSILGGIGPWGQLALSFVPYVGPVIAGLSAGTNISAGLARENWGQAALGAVQGLTASGMVNLPGTVGNAISGGALSQAGANALGSAVINSGLGILNGQNLGQTLKNAAVGGLASYGGSLAGEGLGSLFKDVGTQMPGTQMTPMQLIASNLGSGLAQGGLGALLQGSSLGQGLTMGGATGLAGGLGMLGGSLTSNALKSGLNMGSSNYLNKVFPKATSNLTNRLIQQNLLNQLYKRS